MANIFDNRLLSKKINRQIEKVGQAERAAEEVLESIDRMTMGILSIAPEVLLWENKVKWN